MRNFLIVGGAILALAIVILIQGGCMSKEQEKDQNEICERFQGIDKIPSINSAYYLTDKQTGVKYLVIKSSYGIGITAIIDK
jgi:hypothetical protein